MSVKEKDTIIEIKTGKKLEVNSLWGNASNITDFSAVYKDSIGIDPYGNKLYPSKGFMFKDENKVWKKVK